MIRAGSRGGLEFDLIKPVVIMMDTQPRWYYYLRRGVTSHAELSNVYGGKIHEDMRTMELKGYTISIPSLSELQMLMSRSAPAIGYATSNWHVWSATPSDAAPGSYWAVHAGNLTTGSRIQSYFADMAVSKHIILSVAEAFTVAHGDTQLQRLVMREGMQCCFLDDPKFVEGVPREILGATYFALPEGAHDSRKAGIFVITAAVPVTVYAVAIYDVRANYKFSFDSGFPELGWQQVLSPGFRLMPWRFPMGCWKTSLDPGNVLQVPHQAGLYGALAIKTSL